VSLCQQSICRRVLNGLSYRCAKVTIPYIPIRTVYCVWYPRPHYRGPLRLGLATGSAAGPGLCPTDTGTRQSPGSDHELQAVGCSRARLETLGTSLFFLVPFPVLRRRHFYEALPASGLGCDRHAAMPIRVLHHLWLVRVPRPKIVRFRGAPAATLKKTQLAAKTCACTGLDIS
jgi:hypothetical protein